MLFLLRKIRRKLISTDRPAGNKVVTYFFYGIGEILLVVVGILIAVQIDDWNQHKKENQSIRVSLDFMIEELKKDSISVAEDLQYHEIAAKKNAAFLERIDHPQATLDTILQIMKYEFEGPWTLHFDYNNTTYENMKSSGVFDLLPDSIKTNIHQVYEALERASGYIAIYSQQYKDPLEEYVKRYAAASDTTSLVFKTVWTNIDPQHFVPRARWLVFTRNILFVRYVDYLKGHNTRIKDLNQKLKVYQADLQ